MPFRFLLAVVGLAPMQLSRLFKLSPSSIDVCIITAVSEISANIFNHFEMYSFLLFYY